MKRVILLLALMVLIPSFALAQEAPTLEERVASLESRVAALEAAVGISPSPSPSLGPSPSPEPSPTESPAPEPSPESSLSPSPSTSPVSYPPPSTDGGFGRFRVECLLSHRKQVDPIVNPGPAGTLSAHMHDFFGNTSVDSSSTYASMIAAGTTCGHPADTAGYWAPTFVAPDGSFVEPARMIIYYRNRPVDYGGVVSFPADFRMIAGGEGSWPHAYWVCEGESDASMSTRKEFVPDCGSSTRIRAHVFFPSCWDGVNLDSPDHRSHLAYAFDPEDGTSTDISDDDICPASHPVKVPQVHVRIIYPAIGDPAGYAFSDGEVIMHSDFWNTWSPQSAFEALVRDCLAAGINCGGFV